MTCAYCCNNLSPDDTHTDNAGDPVCDQCWHEMFCFTCVKCHDDELVEYQGAVDSSIVVFDTEQARVPVGVYRVLHSGYWTAHNFDAWIEPSAVELVTSNIGDMRDTICGHAVGHLCRACGEKILQETKA